MFTKTPGAFDGCAALLLIATFVLLPAGSARAQPCHPQLARLLATGGVGAGRFARSVSLSSDGNTAVLGAWGDNNSIGAAYIFVRSGTSWTQQGPKLVPSGGVGQGYFGYSVSISSDGNTAVLGAYRDNNDIGAAYVFVRSGTTWTQQGPKLVPSGGVGQGRFGVSVSLSGEGATAVVAADGDNNFTGAAYVFVRSGTTWTQQGPKLVATGGVGVGFFGNSISISGDGNTVAVGAPTDNVYVGAAYVFVRSEDIWTQQGPKLVPTGGLGAGQFGTSVSLSSDGNAAMVGAPYDNNQIGAAYVFMRSGTTWAQQGPNLVPTGGVGQGQFGYSVSLIGDGDSALIGARLDNGSIGAAYVFASLGGVWTQQGSKLVPTGGVGTSQSFGRVSLSGDGHTAVIGAPGDNSLIGAAYVFGVNVDLTIVSAQPPNGQRDVLQNTNNSLIPQGVGVAGTPNEGPVSYYPVSVTFNCAPAPPPTTGNIAVSCTDIAGNGPGDCPSVSGVSGSGAGPYLISLSGPIPARECISLVFAGTGTGQRLQYQSLPGDVNLNAASTGQDVVALVLAINDGTAGAPANLPRYDINRNGMVTGQDVVRLVQLLNGGLTVLPPSGYNAATVAACP